MRSFLDFMLGLHPARQLAALDRGLDLHGSPAHYYSGRNRTHKKHVRALKKRQRRRAFLRSTRG